jgi:hypothetical protein
MEKGRGSEQPKTDDKAKTEKPENAPANKP